MSEPMLLRDVLADVLKDLEGKDSDRDERSFFMP